MSLPPGASVPPLLEVKDLVVVYGRASRGLDQVSIEVSPGSLVAVLGANGAGKTTLLRAVTGLLPGDPASISAGQIYYRGRRIDGAPPHKVHGLGIALVPERDRIFASLTVEDNLRLAESRPLDGVTRQRWRELVDDLFPILGKRKRQLSGYLSGGERSMLSMASALLTGPDLLLVDELSMGLSPSISASLIRVIRQLNTEAGLTVIMVEQNAAIALEAAHRAYILENGRIVLAGESADLISDVRVRGSYLGLAVGEGVSNAYAAIRAEAEAAQQ